MAEKSADELMRACVAAMRDGADFPIVWQTVLKGHALVVGLPAQGADGGRVHLKIPLITRQWLVFDSASKQFSVS